MTLRGCVVAQFKVPLGSDKFAMNYIDEVFKNVPGMRCTRDLEETGCLKSLCKYQVEGTYRGVKLADLDLSVKNVPLKS